MVIRKMFTCLCCILLLLCLTPAAQAKGMTAAIATGPVVMNGQKIDSSTAQYPLLLYSNITYVPMTYDLCRFMGLTTEWDSDTRTLSISRSREQGAYVPDTGHTRKTGSVSVTRANNPIVVSGVPIDNSVTSYPLFLYQDVTYFPLTFDYIVSFGWTYTWDMANGMNITSLEQPVPTDAAVHTGDPALDEALDTLNAFYRRSHTYTGTLTDRRDGGVETFRAKVGVIPGFALTNVELRADPFVFFANGDMVGAQYRNENNLTDDPIFSTGGHIIDDRPGVLHAPPYDSSTEKAYLAFCLLDCQFSGKRTEKILSSSQDSRDGLTVWQLSVAFEQDGFTGYGAAITLKDGDVSAIEISTDNYTMHLDVTA